MPKLRLGRRTFPADCESVAASRAGVSSEEVALLTRRMLGSKNKFGRMKILNLVSVVRKCRKCCDAFVAEQE